MVFSISSSLRQLLKCCVCIILLASSSLANSKVVKSEHQKLCSTSFLPNSGTVNLRIDNDMFGGVGQDQGYTNGFLLSWVSPNLTNYRDDPCLPDILQWSNSFLNWIQPHGFDERNMTFGIGQTMYTPEEREKTELIEYDRPYAGALLASLGYHASRGDYLQTSQFRFGVVGPAAKAGPVQSQWHDIIGTDRFKGWDNQLRNEPVVQLIHERRWRMARADFSSRWSGDVIVHAGASLGNFATYANAGMEARFGYMLPNDFGTAPLRPAGENVSPIKTPPRSGWAGHLFVAVDGRWVLRDITLDGNTFRNSHSVQKQPFVADIGYGVAITRGKWRIALARYHRTREFKGQRDIPVYGTITIGRRF